MNGAIGLAMAAIVIAALSWPRIKEQRRTVSWEPVWGTLESYGTNKVRSSSRPSHGHVRQPVVRYTYVVNGVTYTGTRFAMHGRNVSDDWCPAGLARGKDNQLLCVVYYDPDAPSNAVLEPSTFGWQVGSLAIPLILGTGSIGLGITALVLRRRQRGSASTPLRVSST